MKMDCRAQIAKLTVSERLKAAREKTPRVLDHILYLLELHENNAIILYSPALSAQIPRSYAANAFNLFQAAMHKFEIVRLCALWDTVELDKENTPTVVELIDHPDVIEALAQETAAQWHGGGGGSIVNPSSDPELHASEVAAWQRINKDFGRKQAQKARKQLRKAIDDSRSILASPKRASIMNLRDKRLAHSLSQTRREQRAGPIAPMNHGDERDMLHASLPIVEALYCWVCGTSFSLEDSRSIHQKNAKALWETCTFKITQ
jgi:hypothetical protein